MLITPRHLPAPQLTQYFHERTGRYTLMKPFPNGCETGVAVENEGIQSAYHHSPPMDPGSGITISQQRNNLA